MKAVFAAEPKPGQSFRDALVIAMCKAHDREDAAQKGEPSPWEFDASADDIEFVSERMASMGEALDVALATLDPGLGGPGAAGALAAPTPAIAGEGLRAKVRHAIELTFQLKSFGSSDGEYFTYQPGEIDLFWKACDEATDRVLAALASPSPAVPSFDDRERLVEALLPFGDIADIEEETGRDDPTDNRILIVQTHGCQLAELTVEDFVRVRAALAPEAAR